MKQDIQSHQFTDSMGNPTGGHTFAPGLCIAWQNGPLGRGPGRAEPNGCFVETVIDAAADRLRFYERSRFQCKENAEAPPPGPDRCRAGFAKGASMFKRLARWIVRDELEQAHVERAEAVNSAIDWRRRADDLRHEAHARGVALQHALACVPDAENVRVRIRADSTLPADLRADAIGYVDWWCPGGILDTSVKNGGGDADGQ